MPIAARIVWADDGEEHIDTVALGWTGRDVYVRKTDTRYRLRVVWLDAADVTRTLGKPPTGGGSRVIDRREVLSRRPKLRCPGGPRYA